ncbi:hypothetical protein [Azospirillum rugosum]|uniref:HAMP domain-containing protein n=1 Tax=Azospirillum rugosum TaxID=416170 RepID=A0ABS4SCK9_9PROT|nr:hypothetical protein [Azospirillum rugosum]MBP2290297.1 hypothetical protein [Azospirillum rugosum]MDQ0527773.1 hypothetical protein [Azospirillum rugosum]
MDPKARRPMRRFMPLLVMVVVVPWLATLAAALIAAAGLADRGAASRAEIVGLGIAHDLEKALTLGLPLDRMAGMEDYLGEAAAVFPEIDLILVVDASGRPLFQKSNAARPELSVRLTPSETDWAALGLKVQRFPVRNGASAAGEVLLGRSAVSQPANAQRILIDFAVAISIALAMGGLLLRAMLHSLVVAPLRLVAALESNLARSAYDRIAPPVEQSLIGGLLAEMNRVVITVNDRFARVRSYLTEVRDLSFNKEAAGQVTPLIARVERLGAFAPDRLAALAPGGSDPLPHVALFAAGVVLAVVTAVAAQRLPLGLAMLGAGVGVALAVPMAHALGRRAAPVAVLAYLLWALLVWGLSRLSTGTPVLLVAVAGVGALAAVLSVQSVRAAGDSLRAGQTVSAAAGFVAGAGLSVLCAGGAVLEIGMVAAALATLVGATVALRLEGRGGSALPRITLRGLAAPDRWWSAATARPKGWALWLVTVPALLCLGLPSVGEAPDLRRSAELVWLHAMPAWLAATVLATMAPRGAGAALAALGGTAVAALVLAFGLVEPGTSMAVLVAAALGIAHAGQAATGEPGALVAARAALTLLAGAVAVWIGAGSALLPAAVSALGLLAGIAVLPPLAVTAWRCALPRRRAIPASGEAL